LFLAVNKVDSAKQDTVADDFHRVGIHDIFPVSAEHGRGVDELLDAVVAGLKALNLFTKEDMPPPLAPLAPTAQEEDSVSPLGEDEGGNSQSRAKSRPEIRVAIIGHPMLANPHF
jgi:GTP-binding protein